MSTVIQSHQKQTSKINFHGTTGLEEMNVTFHLFIKLEPLWLIIHFRPAVIPYTRSTTSVEFHPVL